MKTKTYQTTEFAVRVKYRIDLKERSWKLLVLVIEHKDDSSGSTYSTTGNGVVESRNEELEDGWKHLDDTKEILVDWSADFATCLHLGYLSCNFVCVTQSGSKSLLNSR